LNIEERYAEMKLRVIILEDNDAIRNLLSVILEERGYEIHSFNSPAICPLQITPECRCRGEQACVDVIISDLDMPAVTGLEFIENQKRKHCKCRHIALMSGNLTDAVIRQAKGLECKTFAKPFNLSDIIEWLENVEASLSWRTGLKLNRI